MAQLWSTVCFSERPEDSFYAVADYANSHPTPAVTAMASAPQNVTRIAPIATLAPPARAAKPPRSARNINEVTETNGINLGAGANAVTKIGIVAPAAKLAADANAA